MSILTSLLLSDAVLKADSDDDDLPGDESHESEDSSAGTDSSKGKTRTRTSTRTQAKTTGNHTVTLTSSPHAQIHFHKKHKKV